MRRIALRGTGVFVCAAIIVLLAGCRGPIFRVKVFNEGDFPLTSVRFIPYMEDQEDQEQAFDEAVNLLPRDGDDKTIALDTGKTVLLPHLLRGDLYYVAVTFYVESEYIESVWDALVDLREIERNALITLSVRCEYPSAATEPTITIFFD